MDLKLLPIYFVIGGLIVAATTYFGAQGKGIWAAFISLLPGITVITFITIYIASGSDAVISFARGTLILLPSWILYILGMVFLLPRVGFAPALIISIGLYLAIAFLIIKFT